MTIFGRIPRFLIFLLILLQFLPFSTPCFPRSRHTPRYYHRMPPLDVKERIPHNTPELHPHASGAFKGIVYRGTYKFSKLKQNYNPDIVFLDEEGTGEDRFMTRRASEKLNTLALLVMNRWPSKRLKVTEAWDDSGIHARDSLHYEGRAVDIVLDDHDYANYGHLARLASQAGFDFVYYESQAHVHASVKTDDAPGTRLRGCFPDDAVAQTLSGPKSMRTLEVGDQVLSLDRSSGQPLYSPVVAFAHRQYSVEQDYLRIETETKQVLLLTPNHLIPRYGNSSNKVSRWGSYKLDIVFAGHLNSGDSILVVKTTNINSSSSTDVPVFEEISSIRKLSRSGFHAPITDSGSIVVNNILASCYAATEAEALAHWSLWPIRFAYRLGVRFQSNSSPGEVPSYFRFLILVAEKVLGWTF